MFGNGQPRLRGFVQWNANVQRRSQTARNARAQFMNGVDRAGEALCPNDAVIRGIHEFHTDNDTGMRDLDGSAKHVTHPQQPGGLRHGRTRQAERGAPGNNEQPAQPRNLRNEIVRQGQFQRGQFSRRANAGERQDSDGGPAAGSGRVCRGHRVERNSATGNLGS